MSAFHPIACEAGYRLDMSGVLDDGVPSLSTGIVGPITNLHGRRDGRRIGVGTRLCQLTRHGDGLGITAVEAQLYGHLDDVLAHRSEDDRATRLGAFQHPEDEPCDVTAATAVALRARVRRSRAAAEQVAQERRWCLLDTIASLGRVAA